MNRQILAWWLAVFAVVGIAVYAFADECNPDLISDRTPLCQLLKPQYRQCRPDRDINHDFDLLDGLCSPCPAGQCVTGVDPDTLALACSPCGCTGGGSCTPIACDPGFVLTSVDGGCNFTCTALCQVCTDAGIPSCACGTSTTTTEAPTTSTTTTTTSTTTTTTGPPFSITFIWAPLQPMKTTAEFSSETTADEMRCDMYIPDVGITNADRISFQLSNSGVAVVCAAAIYSADGNTRLGSTGGVDCSGGGTITATGSAFTLVEGTEYQLCHCSNQTHLPAFLIVDNAANTSALANTITPAGSFVASNPCVSGVPPTTTGGSNGTDTHGFPIVLISTSTP